MGEGVESVGHNQIKTMDTSGSFFGHIEPCFEPEEEEEKLGERTTQRERDL